MFNKIYFFPFVKKFEFISTGLKFLKYVPNGFKFEFVMEIFKLGNVNFIPIVYRHMIEMDKALKRDKDSNFKYRIQRTPYEIDKGINIKNVKDIMTKYEEIKKRYSKTERFNPNTYIEFGVAREMSYIDVYVMLVIWMVDAKDRNISIMEFYYKLRNHINLHINTRCLVEYILGFIDLDMYNKRITWDEHIVNSGLIVESAFEVLHNRYY